MYYVLSIVLPYLFVFYVFDCFMYLKDGHSAFSHFLGGKYAFTRSGLHLVAPFPYSEVYLTYDVHIFLSETHLHYFTPGSEWQNQKYCPGNRLSIAYDKISRVQKAENVVTINGDLPLRFPDKTIAGRAFDSVEAMVRAEPAARPALISGNVNEATNWEKLLEKYVAVKKLATPLKALVCLLFISVFIILPVINYSPLHETIQPLYVLTPILALYAATVGTDGYLAAYFIIAGERKATHILDTGGYISYRGASSGQGMDKIRPL